MNNDKELEAVMQILSRRGFKQAEAVLKIESNKTQSLESVALRGEMELTNPTNITNFMYKFNSSEAADPSNYSKYYLSFREWVSASLDMYQQELFPLLYPVFVHCYLDLVSKGKQEVAQSFMDQFGQEHLELHADEVQRLRAVTTPELLQSSEVAQLFRTNRFNVQLSKFSFELLLAFIHDNNYTLLLSILNKYINFKVSSRQPTVQKQAHGGQEYNAILEKSANEVNNINSYEIFWGLFDELVPRPKEPVSTSDDEESERSEKEPPNKKTKADDKKNAKEKKASTEKSSKDKGVAPMDTEKITNNNNNNNATIPTASSTIKLPKLTEQVEMEMLEDMSKRVALSRETLPSICFYTLFHTHSSANHIELSPNATLAVGCFADSSVRLWDVKRSRERERILQQQQQQQSDNNNSTAATTTANQQQQQQQLQPPEDHKVLIGHSGPVFGASFSPDSQWILTASEDKTVRLWSVETRSNVVSYRGHNYPVWDVDFSALGFYFASASHDRTARLWCTDHISPLRVFAGHLSDVNCVKFHPNCNYIATGSSDKSIRLWDINSAAPVRIFTGHYGPINCLAFSPDGKYLASADDSNIILWDLASSRKVSTLIGHTNSIYSLAFSADSSLLASGSADETVRLWDFNSSSNNTNHATNSGTSSASDVNGSGVDNTKSPELVKTFLTKKTPVFQVKFTRRNLLMAAGPYRADDNN